MKIVIPGGTGQLGHLLARHYTAQGHEVVILSRSARDLPWKTVVWDAKNQGDWSAEIDGADVVINLAGRSVNCRYNAENQRLIKQSRIDSTHAIGIAIQNASAPPKVWLQASTATIYAHRFDAPNDEATGIIGDEHNPNADPKWAFSIDVAKSWEATANAADLPNTRLVLLRAAMVMSPDKDGVFDVLLGLTRKGLGGRNGNGQQYISWIHGQDFVRALDFLIETEDIKGAVNLAAPAPLPNKDFMRILRETARVPIGLPATKWMLEIGAFFMATETELLLKSRRVVPGRLLEEGFVFDFPDWAGTCKDLLHHHPSTEV